ncbi:hypothetical protein Kpol_1040p11 [Vanderwaltozyma polyspora DSM 70294]|uniref:LDB19 N-terminal domain-containing protein n=1 Tax=Vanderwaltozyma polyspora (strain ATCC 22028 / DSM 70294 / BCRC 21397 / CBS 2163 / NBRC 10782 / NRRL Y-8283 / UCD 57-17) TaxID=436907 RepID=A7TPK6_VANPO|nr:uncharacterized protein Kpol_1040p11 [Vanderwaltozyma polyspora DSM 70294]EDO15798.1 hypothetical protein Kpol_1040p11 [Vanderwaltozyma polyspora DSM 70294]
MSFAKLLPKANNKGLGSGRRSENKNNNKHPIQLILDIETPPCVLFGSTTSSTGALLGGLLTLIVNDDHKQKSNVKNNSPPISSDIKLNGKYNGSNNDRSSSPTKAAKKKGSIVNRLTFSRSNSPVPSNTENKPQDKTTTSNYESITIKSVELQFIQNIHYEKPFVQGPTAIQTCKDCSNKTVVLKKWDIENKETTMNAGSHAFPFSYLIPGDTPATASLGSKSNTTIKYELVANVRYINANHDSKTSLNLSNISLSLPVMLTRSLTKGPDRNSLRVFPPTKLTASAVLPNVIYPKSTFPLEMKFEGISTSTNRWRMRKLSWRIEETTKIRNNVCKHHVTEMKKVEKEIKIKEIERAKRQNNPIKRYGEPTPVVTVSIGKNSATKEIKEQFPQRIAANEPSSTVVDNADQDEENETPDTFIHPSDDALRQEVQMQRQRVKEEQEKQEKQNESSIFTEEVRIISESNIKSGWKTDFDNEGKIEIVTDIDCTALNSGVSNPLTHASTLNPLHSNKKNTTNVSCTIQAPQLGIYVSHILAVEIVVAEEGLQYANGTPLSKSNSPLVDKSITDSDQRLAELSPMLANRNSGRRKPISEPLSKINSRSSAFSSEESKALYNNRIIGVPTGAARVLRMQFRLNLTERSGLGISWDEEVPPIYQNINFISPPSYDRLTENSSDMAPVYIENDGYPARGDEVELARELVVTPSTNLDETPVQKSETPKSLSSNELQMPELDSVISIEGSVPNFNNPLTPRVTRDIRLANVSELVDTDRITQ